MNIDAYEERIDKAMEAMPVAEQLEDDLIDLLDLDSIPVGMTHAIEEFQQQTIEAIKAFAAKSILPMAANEADQEAMFQTLMSLQVVVHR